MANLIIFPFFLFRRGNWGIDILTFTTSQGHREGAPRFKPAVRLRSLQTSPSCYSVPFVRTLFCQPSHRLHILFVAKRRIRFGSRSRCGWRPSFHWLKALGARVGAGRVLSPRQQRKPTRPRLTPLPGPRGLTSFPPSGWLPQRRVGPLGGVGYPRDLAVGKSLPSGDAVS